MGKANISLQESVAYLCAAKVAEICLPFFSFANLNYFSYSRKYHDGSFFYLVNDSKWLSHYFANQYPIGSTVITSGVHLWEDYLPIIVAPAAQFSYCFGISFFKACDNYIEACDFAAPITNLAAIDFYFNHADLLKNKFIAYFKQKASAIIASALDEGFILPQSMYGKPHASQVYEYKKVYEFIRPDRIRVNHGRREIIFSKREHECLASLAKGKTVKEIANNLNLSPRTIEFYVGNAKKKVGCNYKNQFIEMVWEHQDCFIG
jgi:DNA-binding CsgD family transcriptional regulator